MFKYADYIYEIYKEKSFTAAAKNLFISQPALSATVKKLETELGVKLFDRQANPLRLTDAGEAYIKAVEDIHKVKYNFENYVQDTNDMRRGHVTVSAANFISSFVLPKIIIEFIKEYPDIQIELVESNSTSLQELLLGEKIELLLDYDFDEKLYTSYPLLEEHILLAVPKELACEKKILQDGLSTEDILQNKHLDPQFPAFNLSVLADARFLLMKLGNDMRFRGKGICQAYGIQPQNVLYLDQMMTTYNMSRSGMGVAFVPDMLVRFAPAGEDLVFFKLDNPLATRELYIGHKKHRYVSNAMGAFVKTTQAVCDALASQHE